MQKIGLLILLPWKNSAEFVAVKRLEEITGLLVWNRGGGAESWAADGALDRGEAAVSVGRQEQEGMELPRRQILHASEGGGCSVWLGENRGSCCRRRKCGCWMLSCRPTGLKRRAEMKDKAVKPAELELSRRRRRKRTGTGLVLLLVSRREKMMVCSGWKEEAWSYCWRNCPAKINEEEAVERKRQCAGCWRRNCRERKKETADSTEELVFRGEGLLWPENGSQTLAGGHTCKQEMVVGS